MIDFSSALYLGLKHPAYAIRPWEALSAGKPAVLADPEGACEVAWELASLMGCERGMLFPSTLHVFWDLFTTLMAGRGVMVYMDAGVYAVVRWGIERAMARGLRVQGFPHHNAEALCTMLKQNTASGLKPVVVTDGFCPPCGNTGPIKAYLKCVREYRGYLVIDDTQAFGILGERGKASSPYGRGGGGTLRWNGVQGDDIVVVNSLAKGFGVPVAVLAGSKAFVDDSLHRSETRVYCSPPSVAIVRAAEHALQVNKKCGDVLRSRLAQQVNYFRRRLAEIGLSTVGGLFPMQTLVPAQAQCLDPTRLYKYLMRSGIRTVLQRANGGKGARVSFLVTVRHNHDDIDQTVDVLSDAISRQFVNQHS